MSSKKPEASRGKPFTYDKETFWFWREVVESIARLPRFARGTDSERNIALVVAVLSMCRTGGAMRALAALIAEAEQLTELNCESHRELLREAKTLLKEPKKLEFFSQRDLWLQGLIAGYDDQPAAAVLNAARIYALEQTEFHDELMLDRPFAGAAWAILAADGVDCERLRRALVAEPAARAPRPRLLVARAKRKGAEPSQRVPEHTVPKRAAGARAGQQAGKLKRVG